MRFKFTFLNRILSKLIKIIGIKKLFKIKFIDHSKKDLNTLGCNKDNTSKTEANSADKMPENMDLNIIELLNDIKVSISYSYNLTIFFN
jgi:hypothetical protein